MKTPNKNLFLLYYIKCYIQTNTGYSMPLNQYECQSCSYQHEALQNLTQHLLLCPACSKDTLKKQLFASGIVLKGGGWYKTTTLNRKHQQVIRSHDNKSRTILSS